MHLLLFAGLCLTYVDVRDNNMDLFEFCSQNTTVVGTAKTVQKLPPFEGQAMISGHIQCRPR